MLEENPRAIFENISKKNEDYQNRALHNLKNTDRNSQKVPYDLWIDEQMKIFSI